jgi:hypothetical protein
MESNERQERRFAFGYEQALRAKLDQGDTSGWVDLEDVTAFIECTKEELDELVLGLVEAGKAELGAELWFQGATLCNALDEQRRWASVQHGKQLNNVVRMPELVEAS